MNFDDFKNLYSISKTLRFELKPVGKTLENIIRDGILEQDQHRAESYQKVKKIIDDYHKSFIDKALSDCVLGDGKGGEEDLLTQYVEARRGKNEDAKKFKLAKEALRKRISEKLKKTDGYRDMFKKELIQKILPAFVGDDEENRKLVAEFDHFTTYFGGFNINRENMYSAEEQSTAIAYRLVDENLPRFVENLGIYTRIKEADGMKEEILEVQKAFEPYLQGTSMDQVFSLSYFNNLLTQRRIELYNALIGGRTEEDGTKVQGLNEKINLYNQQHNDTRLPRFQVLYKQILSDRVAVSWLPDVFTRDSEVLNAVKSFYEGGAVEALRGCKTLMSLIGKYNMEGIFIRNDQQLSAISNRLWGRWDALKQVVVEMLVKEVKQKKNENDEDYIKRLDKEFRERESFSISFINSCMGERNVKIQDYFSAFGSEEGKDLLTKVEEGYETVSGLLNGEYPKEKNLSQDTDSVEKLKLFLDSLLDVLHFIKPLLGSGDEPNRDGLFYAELTPIWDALDKVTPLYNKVRNYMTRKPYSVDKIKLNFDNATLLNGWPESMEINNSGLIFRDSGNYYLGILKKEFRNNFNGHTDPQDENDVIEKMIYMQGGDMGKNVQNLMVIDGKTRKVNGRKEKTGEFAGSNLRLEQAKCEHLPCDINRIRLQRSYSVSSNEFCKDDLCTFIDYYKQRVEEYYSDYSFRFKASSDYDSFDDFTSHVNSQAYQIYFRPISRAYINNLIEEGKLFFFQIYNKDFSVHSHGTPNMHTLYWRMLFDEQNLSNVVYKLNGEAEVFFRKRSLECDRPTHPKGVAIANKNENNQKKESTFQYDLVKDRRYTVDKFQFHVPITLNFKAKGESNINELVYQYLAQSQDTHVIGIDRGERHLLYLVLIGPKGNIIKQFSLNKIANVYNGQEYTTDYHTLLDKRENKRQEARRSWQTIEGIKELKEGYLSQVVHKITKLMVEYHAIVVLEDLNIGFMRGRQKVEKQVYQKFEKMLIDKLNYLVDKKANPSSPGGLLNAYQLTNKFTSFREMTKQNGFLFYIPAWNTSKIDPVTGFVNMLDTNYYNVSKAQEFFGKFESIRYNAKRGWFEFDMDYMRFGDKAKGTRTRWTICTNDERIESFRNPEKNNQWDTRKVDLTHEIRVLLSEYDISTEGEIKAAVVSQDKPQFFERLLHLLRLTLQMRNSVPNTETDYLISPVQDSKGQFFDSRRATSSLPENADANGAYNIARKGLMVLRQICAAWEGGTSHKNLKLDLTNKAWLRFAQEKPYLDE